MPCEKRTPATDGELIQNNCDVLQQAKYSRLQNSSTLKKHGRFFKVSFGWAMGLKLAMSINAKVAKSGGNFLEKKFSPKKSGAVQ
ncbi:MAG: hypothetical protein P1P64_09780 [Treponemataceae bacterium]